MYIGVVPYVPKILVMGPIKCLLLKKKMKKKELLEAFIN
jgi:hypothetical protein